MTDPRWRWHPITRIVAGALALGMFGAALVVLVGGVASLRAGNWPGVAMMLVAIPAAVRGRPFFIGAWTGEEPAAPCEDDAEEADERVT